MCPSFKSVSDCRLEVLSIRTMRAKRVDRKKVATMTKKNIVIRGFSVGDLVLVVHGQSPNKVSKLPAFKRIYYGPCKVKVVRVNDSWFTLKSSAGPNSRVATHACRLVKYQSRPTSLGLLESPENDLFILLFSFSSRGFSSF